MSPIHLYTPKKVVHPTSLQPLMVILLPAKMVGPKAINMYMRKIYAAE